MSRSNQPEVNKALFACVYVRVSTDEQTNNTSLANQIEHTIALAYHFNMLVSEDHILREDISATTLNRPKLNILREWVRKRQVEAIIIHSSDRLSRNPAHAEELLDEMQAHNIRLFIAMHNREFDLNNPIDRNQILMEMDFNHKWHHMLVEVMKSGRHKKTMEGKIVGYGLTKFGYSKTRNAEGDIELSINGEEAVIIQDMFDSIVNKRIGVNEIQRRLRGTPSPLDRKGLKMNKKWNYSEWNQSTIYRILRDPAYKGMLKQFVGDQATYASVPIIVEPQLWDQAQEILDRGKKYLPRNKKHPFLLARRITCGTCHHAFTTQVANQIGRSKQTYYYYVCGTYKNPGKYTNGKCGMPYFYARTVDGHLWNWITKIINDPRELANKLTQSKSILDKHNAPLLARVAQIEETRQKQYNKIDMLAEIYSPTDTKAQPELRAMLDRLRAETATLLEELRQQEEELRAKLADTTITQEFIQSCEQYAHTIRDTMDSFTVEERQKLIETLKIKATLALEDGIKVLYVHLYEYTDRIPLDIPVKS